MSSSGQPQPVPPGPVTTFLAELSTNENLLSTWNENRAEALAMYQETLPEGERLSEKAVSALTADDLGAVQELVVGEMSAAPPPQRFLSIWQLRVPNGDT